MKFEKLQPGMVLYDVGRHKMGNTTMSTVAVWRVRVISVDAEKRTAVVSWNGNTPRTYYPAQIAKLREKEPQLVKAGLGMRLANREEQKAARAAVGAA